MAGVKRLAAGVKVILVLLAIGAVLLSPFVLFGWLYDTANKWSDTPKPPPPSVQPYHQSYEQAMEEQAIQDEQRVDSSSDDEFEDRCEYDPTINNDWHDDMVCDGQRLYLRPNDDFVDQQELEQAARKWIAKH